MMSVGGGGTGNVLGVGRSSEHSQGYPGEIVSNGLIDRRVFLVCEWFKNNDASHATGIVCTYVERHHLNLSPSVEYIISSLYVVYEVSSSDI